MYAAFVALGLTFAGEHLSNDSHEGSEVDRWKAKVLADDEAGDIDFAPLTTNMHWLVTQKTGKFSEKNPRDPMELKTYQIECRIDYFFYEDDGDIHLVLKDKSDSMIGEIPFPYYPTASSSGFKTRFKKARKQFHTIVDGDNYKNKTVIVTGVGFIDKSHGQRGRAPNNLELHPTFPSNSNNQFKKQYSHGTK